MSDVTIEIPVGSVEYLYADIIADVDLDGTVEIGLGAPPSAADWATAEWVGVVGPERSARVLLDGTLAVGQHVMWARITDTPEIPIIKCGKVKVVNR